MDGLTVSALTAGLTNILSPSPNPSFCLLRPTSFATVLSAAPSFMYVLVGGGGLVFEPFPPRAPPPLPWSPFIPRNPTHYADSNSNVLCRIPGHRLAIVPPLIIPTTDYTLHLEHEPLRCGAGIKKHTRDIPRPSPESKGASIDFTLSAATSCLSRIVTRSTLNFCSFHSWSIPKFFPQVDLDLFLLQKLPFCALLKALGVILL